MKNRQFLLFVLTTFLLVCSVRSHSQDIRLVLIEGFADSTSVIAGETVTFGFLVRNMTSDTIISSNNSFVLFSPDDASWIPWLWVDTGLCFPPPGCTTFDTTYYGEWIDPASLPGRTWGSGDDPLYNVGLFVNWRSDHDNNPLTPPLLGIGCDSINFGGIASESKYGIPSGISDVIWLIRLDSVTSASIGKTICMDSINTPPVSPGDWVWNTTSGVVSPAWSGSRCFSIVADCCEGSRGNINLDLISQIDISDLTSMVGWLYRSQSPPPCLLEADVNGDSAHDILDLAGLVDYMFKNGPEPAGCP